MEKLPQIKQGVEKKDAYVRYFKLVNLALRAAYEQHITGTENILDEPALYLMNHLKFADSLLLGAAYTKKTGEPLRFIAKSGYFEGEGIRFKNRMILGRTMRHFVTHTGMISADRSGGIEGLKQLTASTHAAFGRGESVGGHPDSTRGENNKVNKLYPALIRIGMDAHVPLVPVSGHYFESQSPAHLSAVGVHFGEPIMPEQYEHGIFTALPRSRRVAHFTNIIEKRIAAGAGLERSGEYMEDIRAREQSSRLDLQ